MVTKAEHDHETERSRHAFAELFRLNNHNHSHNHERRESDRDRGGEGQQFSPRSPARSPSGTPRASFGRPSMDGRARRSSIDGRTDAEGGVGYGGAVQVRESS
jgi:hypothetical protein